MPKRSPQHQLEDLSRSKFNLLLPQSWVCRDKAKDYGIDQEVELFSPEGNPLGLIFWVQLKATSSSSIKEILSVKMNIDTLEYYNNLPIPVILIRYSESNDLFYYKWLYKTDLTQIKKGAKTIQINLQESDKWVDGSPLLIENHIKKLKYIKEGPVIFPLPISLTISEPSINGIAKSILSTSIKRNINGLSNFFTITDQGDAIVWIKINKNKTIVSFIDYIGTVLHSTETKDKSIFQKNIFIDIMSGVFYGLINLGYVEKACQLMFGTDICNELINSPMFLKYIPHLLDSAYTDKIFELVKNIKNDETTLLFFTHFNYALLSLKGKEESVINFLLSSLDFAISVNDNELIGVSHYNIGNYYFNLSQFNKSVHHYNQSRKYAPNYLKRHYYFQELAGCLFLNGRYRLSSKFYAKSLEIKDDILTTALYADSLMYAGDYGKSIYFFTKYIESAEEISVEFYLKLIFLKYTTELFNITNQERFPRESLQILEQIHEKEEQINTLYKSLELDLLNFESWKIMGALSNKEGNYILAYISFTMSALIETTDCSSWAYATLFSLISNAPDELVGLIIRTAYEKNRDNYLNLLYIVFDENGLGNHLEYISDNIESYVSDIVPKKRIPISRIFADGEYVGDLYSLIKKHNPRK